MREEPQFIDAEEFMGRDSELSFQQIVFRHLAGMSKITQGEFREGYWEKKPVTVGSGIFMSQTYTEDKRASYINSVDFLNDLLLPHFDKDMTKDSETLEKELKDSLVEFQKENKDKNDWVDEKLDIKRKLFQKLSLLLKRLNYLKSKQFKQ